MRRLRGPSWPPEEIDAEVNDIIGMYEIEKQLEGTARWAQCFQGTDLRRTLLTIGCLLSQELSGVAFIAGSVPRRLPFSLHYSHTTHVRTRQSDQNHERC